MGGERRMGKMSKRTKVAREVIDRNTLYTVEEAMAKVKATATAKFDETVDVAVKLGVNPKHADQMVRGAVALPHGLGKVIRVLVFELFDQRHSVSPIGRPPRMCQCRWNTVCPPPGPTLTTTR